MKELVTLCLEVGMWEEERVEEHISRYALLLDLTRAASVISRMTAVQRMCSCWRILAAASEGEPVRGGEAG